MELPYLQRRSEKLTRMTGIVAREIECCLNGCMAFTGSHTDDTACLECDQPRWKSYNPDTSSHDGPFKTFKYIPLIPRLKLQYKSQSRAKVLQTYRQQPHLFAGDSVSDWWSGTRFQELRNEGLFEKPTDMALSLLLDGVQVTQRQNYASNPIILLNYNLPPSERQKLQNVLLSFVIPGPQKQKNLDSFMRPLIDELKLLSEGVKVFDAFRKRTFTLRAHVVVVSGMSYSFIAKHANSSYRRWPGNR